MAFNGPKEVEQLLQGLNKVIDELMQKGMLPALNAVQKKALMFNVANKLIKDNKSLLSISNLNSTENKNALGVACMAEHHTKGKFDIVHLFRNKFGAKDDVTNQLKKLLEEMLQLKLDPNKKKKLDPKQKELLDKLLRLMENECKDDPNKKLALMAALLRELGKMKGDLPAKDDIGDSNRQLFGVDTRMTGQLRPVIQSVIGNLAGVVDTTKGQGESFEANINKADPGTLDPAGSLARNIINDIAAGGSLLITELEESHQLGSPSTAPTPLSTKPSTTPK